MSDISRPQTLRSRAEHRAKKRGFRVSIADLQADPSQLVSPLDLCDVRLVGSYPWLQQAIKDGRFPGPLPDPHGSGRLHWQASVILGHFGLLPSQDMEAA